MAHPQPIDDPEEALHAMDQQRKRKLALFMAVSIGIIGFILASLVIMYSDTAATSPGLQTVSYEQR